MFKIFKWLDLAALGLVLLFAALVFALHRWVSTDDFKQRLSSQASTVGRLEARPQWRPLLGGRVREGLNGFLVTNTAAAL